MLQQQNLESGTIERETTRHRTGHAIEAKPLWVVALVSIALIGMAVLARFVLWHDYFVPIGYAVPLLVFLWLRDRRFLWGVAACFWAMTWVKLYVILEGKGGGAEYPCAPAHIALIMQTFDLLLVTAIIHYLIHIRAGLEVRNRDLASTNEDLAKREEEIARQNEELQSQTEELERQSEELRLTNDELGAREKTLEHLLALSRSLGVTRKKSEVMSAVCEALGYLMSGRGTAAAILERRGDKMEIVCHHGFGPEGPDQDIIPLDQSFAAMVIHRAQTAYLEDVDLRPDLKIPQPKSGEPLRSILATPLRVAGRAQGSMEIYVRERQAWSEEQIALMESLAAQVSISLEAAQLFDDVEQERDRLSTVLETVPFGVAIANADCSEVRLNRTAAAMLSVPSDMNVPPFSMQAKWKAYRQGEALTPEQHPLLRACRGEEIESDELELVFASGKRLTILVSAAPIYRKQSVVGAVSAWADITHQKELQAELDRKRREAEEASVRKTRFLAAVSHDIRTPANAINLLAELMRRTANNPAMAAEIPTMAGELQSSATSLVNLVSDVLDLTRFDSGKIELTESGFSLGDAVAEEVRQLQPLAQAKGLKLEVQPPTQPIMLRADRIKLGRVLANLAGNAIKFTVHGQVNVSCSMASDRRVYVRVVDTGIGIEHEHLPRIFDEFYQLRNPERDSSKGTGLGLTICKRLVAAMGGDLLVESTPGKGSTFTLVLPAASVVGQAPVSSSTAASSRTAGLGADGDGTARLHGMKILIIEDHASTRSSTRQLLVGEGAVVEEARDGSTGLQMIERFRPHVLLLDMMLPDINGGEILRKLADGSRPSELKTVLVLTGDLSANREEEIKRLGADDFVPKPINIGTLINTIRIRRTTHTP